MTVQRFQISLVCFDLGGVLVRLASSFAARCGRSGVPARGECDPSVAAELSAAHGAGRLTDEQWAEAYARATRGLYSAEEVLCIHDAWLIEEFPGIDRVVAGLRARGIRTACLSNTTESHWVRLVHRQGDSPLPGPPEFPTIAGLDWRFASHRLGVVKPDPAIYLEFERRTGRAGSEIVFFDDLAPNVDAARTLGWTATRIDPEGDPAAQMTGVLRELGLL